MMLPNAKVGARPNARNTGSYRPLVHFVHFRRPLARDARNNVRALSCISCMDGYEASEPAFRFCLKTALETRVRSWFTMNLCLCKAGVYQVDPFAINNLKSTIRCLRTSIRITVNSTQL